MATAEEYMRELDQAIAAQGDAGPLTIAGAQRKSAERMANVFGLHLPPLRTAIDLRVFGDGVLNHDLDAGLAGQLLIKFSHLVAEVASKTKHIRHAPRLFVSPEVKPGSTIMTLFGAEFARPGDDNPLEIMETPLDQTMVEVFSVFKKVSGLTDESKQTDIKLNRNVGDQVFALANELIDNGLDLDITWTRAIGTSQATTFDRPIAKRVRTVLDRPIEDRREWSDPGVLTAISTDGEIRVKVSGRQWRIVEMEVPASELERLPALFGKEVRVKYWRTSIKHPSRSRDDVRYEFISIDEWTPDPQPTNETLL